MSSRWFNKSFLILVFILAQAALFSQNSVWHKVDDPKKMPYFGTMDEKERGELIVAVDHSLKYLNRPSSKLHYPIQGISHERNKKSLERFKELLTSSLNADQLDQKIKKEFDVYESVGKNEKKQVLFTGYFEPIYHGSLIKTNKYKYPLYRKPLDLCLDKKGKVIGRKTAKGEILFPYWTRQDIDDRGVLEGQNLELVYLDNPYDAYVAQFQGSVAVQLESGIVKRFGYSARNGSTVGYSLAKELLDAKKMEKKELLPEKIASYFYQNPDELSHYLKKNTSYVFFTERKEGPMGALSVYLASEKAISTDHKIFPKAALAFIDLKLYKNKQNHPFQHFVLNQDTGGAIIGPGRCEIFFGSGEEAKLKASDMFSYGKLYFLFLKER